MAANRPVPALSEEVRSIQVPGCWGPQGAGAPGMSLPWDITNVRNPRPLNHVYYGAAVYRKKVEIPDSWRDRENWLKDGGVRTEGTFWVNGRRLGSNNAFCGRWKFRITDFVTRGEPI